MVYRQGVMTLVRTEILLTAAVVGGCTLKADKKEISIEHLATQPGVAQAMADSHWPNMPSSPGGFKWASNRPVRSSG